MRHQTTDELTAIARRCDPLSASLLSDCLGELGLSRLGLDGVSSHDLAHRIAGPAFTVQCRPAAAGEPPRIEYLQDIPPGVVVVLANDGRLDCSVWGGQRSLAARQRGAVGCVVDGAYRDIAEHDELGFPVFGKGRTVVGSNGFANPVTTQVPITVSGIQIAPGDFIVGDSSGVVRIPSDRLPEILDVAEREAARERRIRADVDGGRDFLEAKAAAR